MRSAAGLRLIPEWVPLSLAGGSLVSGGSGVGWSSNTTMPLANAPGVGGRPHGALTDGPIILIPIVRAVSSVVRFDTRQSPIEYHMRMSLTGLPNSGSRRTWAAVVIGS
jgi:hypothetical protein